MKRKKNLVVLLLVLVLLIGATVVVTNLNKDGGDDGIQELNSVILAVDPASVTELGWNYSEDVRFVSTGSGWEYAADAAFRLDESYINTALDTLTEVTASKIIENVEDWDQYGLAAPVCSVTVTADTTYTLSFGEESTLSGKRYCSIGDGNAYLVDTACMEPFTYGLYDLLVSEEIPAMDNVTGLEIKNESGTMDITYQESSGKSYSDSYVWFLNGQTLDTELTETLVSAVSSVSWNKCSNFNAADLSVYGLDNPAATVTVHYGDSNTFSLEIGNTSNDACYAKLPGSSMVYLIDGSIGDALVNASYDTLKPDDVLAMDWRELQVMEITLDGVIYEVAQTTPATIDEEGNVTDEAIYKLDGTRVNAAGIPNALDAMVSVGYATDIDPERGEEIRFLFHREHSTYPEIELVFYQYDSTQCLVTLNGESTVFVARDQVNTLIEAVNQMVLG